MTNNSTKYLIILALTIAGGVLTTLSYLTYKVFFSDQIVGSYIEEGYSKFIINGLNKQSIQNSNVITMGRSLVQFAFNADTASPATDEMQSKIFNFGQGSGIGTAAIGIAALKKLNIFPKFLVISNDNYYFSPSPVDESAITTLNECGLICTLNTLYLNTINYYLLKYVRTFFGDQRISAPVELRSRFDGSTVLEVFGVNVGYTESDPILEDSNCAKWLAQLTPLELENHNRKNKDSIKVARRFKDLLSANRSQMILISVPRAVSNCDKIDTEKLAKTVEVPFLDFSAQNLRTFDGIHLNSQSAALYIRAFDKAFKKFQSSQ